MEKNYDEQLIIMQASIESNKQEMKVNKQASDDKMTKFIEEFKTMLAAISDQINIFKSSLTKKD